MSSRIRREDQGGLCTLTLDRPEKLNALDTQAFEELDAQLADLESRTATIGCVMLRGAGRGFSAGADLGGMAAAPTAFKAEVIDRLAALPQPVIAAIHGVCFTGALELALAADLIVADATARFADTHGRWGLVAGWGMIQRLPRRIGTAAARRMMLTGCEIGAAEAQAIGLVDMLAEDDGLCPTATRTADAILANSWHSNRHAKRILRETEGMALGAALAWERDHHPGHAPDHAERVAAFGRR